MSARKEAFKQSKHKDKDFMKSLIQNVRNHWPDQIISEEHLQNPTPEFVKSFYIHFYSEYEKVSSDHRTNIMRLEFTPDQNIHYDEISLTRKLNRLCQPLGIPFNLNDICEPQPKRTLTYFSVLMNVLMFLKSKTGYIDEIEECVEKKNHLDQLKENKSALLEELGNLNELHVQLEHNKMDFDQSIQTLSKEYESVIMQKAEKSFKYQQDIKIITKLKEDIKASDEHINNLREEFSLVLEQIVSENEVEKLQEEIDDLKKQFTGLDIDRTNVVAGLKVQEKNNFYNKCLASVENSLFSNKNLDCLKLQIENLSTLNNELNTLDETMNSKRTELITLKEDVNNLNNELPNLQKELDGLNREYEDKFVKLREKLNMLVSKIKKDKETFLCYENKNTNDEATISSLKNDIANVNSHFSNMYKKFTDNEKEVLQKFYEAVLNIKNTQSRLH